MNPVTVTVSGLCETPTAPPSPTATATPVAPATPRPTVAPTHVPRPVYLPLALNEECVPRLMNADVALVIDASTSMLLETDSGGTQLGAAREAVRLFLERLDLTTDRAAIIAFNAEAEVLQGLTNDRGALNGALSAIEPARHTCLVCAVDTAAQVLAGGRRGGGIARVMILLTDGKSNPRPASEAVERAEEARVDGITIFTIGLGEHLDLWALEAMASRSSYFYRAPDAEDLKAIYEEIAVEIPCPVEDYWGRRCTDDSRNSQ